MEPLLSGPFRVPAGVVPTVSREAGLRPGPPPDPPPRAPPRFGRLWPVSRGVPSPCISPGWETSTRGPHARSGPSSATVTAHPMGATADAGCTPRRRVGALRARSRRHDVARTCSTQGGPTVRARRHPRGPPPPSDEPPKRRAMRRCRPRPREGRESRGTRPGQRGRSQGATEGRTGALYGWAGVRYAVSRPRTQARVRCPPRSGRCSLILDPGPGGCCKHLPGPCLFRGFETGSAEGPRQRFWRNRDPQRDLAPLGSRHFPSFDKLESRTS